MEINDAVIVVTGASHGIGKATAKYLGAGGAKLVLAARSGDELKKLAKELDEAVAVTADLRKPKDVDKIVKTAMNKYGRIDIWINNAGQGMYGPIESVDLDDYKALMELNVYAVMRAMKAVIPIMRKQGKGMIVNVSSRVSKNYFPRLGAYASTKYALNAISLTARSELAQDGIIVSVMYPKLTATDFGRNARGERSAYVERPAGQRQGVEIDPPEAVAAKIGELIRSEAAEMEM